MWIWYSCLIRRLKNSLWKTESFLACVRKITLIWQKPWHAKIPQDSATHAAKYNKMPVYHCDPKLSSGIIYGKARKMNEQENKKISERSQRRILREMLDITHQTFFRKTTQAINNMQEVSKSLISCPITLNWHQCGCS